jgi:predicted ArsR family transcriptional regulator
MKNARQRIIEIFESRRNASAIEISRILNTTPANIRHHLSILREEKVIEGIGERSLPGPGRPPVVYALSRHTQTHNLDRLASAMLEEMLGGMPPADQTTLLRHIAIKLASIKRTTKSSLTQRLYQAVQRLDEMSYLAHWEARAEAPQIILAHCPYAAILADHQELCRFDALLLEELLSTPVKQSARLAKDPNGLTYCMFMVGE